MGLAASLAPVVRREAATKFARAVGSVGDRLDRTVPVKTGKLKRSRRTRFVTTPTLLTANVEYSARSPEGADYGEMLDEGTRPHRIVARRAKVLRFVVGGQVIFRRSVFHPGSNRHRGWFSRPIADYRTELGRVFGR